MGKSRISAGAQKRRKEQEKDLAKAEKRRALEKARAEGNRKRTMELIRSGQIKLAKTKPSSGIFGLHTSLPNLPRVRRDDVVLDEHTTPKKEPSPFTLDGDTRWV